MSESANIQENVTDLMNRIIINAQALATQLKRAELYKRNNGRDFIREIIVLGYCTMYFSHMTESDLDEIVENTLAYFSTGLYDTNKTNRMNVINRQPSYHVRAWVYTPDTHNDAGEWFLIYAFEKNYADKCINMLKEIEAELKKIN